MIEFHLLALHDQLIADMEECEAMNAKNAAAAFYAAACKTLHFIQAPSIHEEP